jgi:hypothetical protein
MTTTLSLLLLAASAAGQITTSFLLPQLLGTDRITFAASALGADKDRMTLAISPINDTDYVALGLLENVTQTYTFASTMYEFSTSKLELPGTAEDAYFERCEMQTTATEVTCSISFGPEFGRRLCHSVPATPRLP